MSRVRTSRPISTPSSKPGSSAFRSASVSPGRSSSPSSTPVSSISAAVAPQRRPASTLSPRASAARARRMRHQQVILRSPCSQAFASAVRASVAATSNRSRSERDVGEVGARPRLPEREAARGGDVGRVGVEGERALEIAVGLGEPGQRAEALCFERRDVEPLGQQACAVEQVAAPRPAPRACRRGPRVGSGASLRPEHPRARDTGRSRRSSSARRQPGRSR